MRSIFETQKSFYHLRINDPTNKIKIYRSQFNIQIPLLERGERSLYLIFERNRLGIFSKQYPPLEKEGERHRSLGFEGEFATGVKGGSRTASGIEESLTNKALSSRKIRLAAFVRGGATSVGWFTTPLNRCVSGANLPLYLAPESVPTSNGGARNICLLAQCSTVVASDKSATTSFENTSDSGSLSTSIRRLNKVV